MASGFVGPGEVLGERYVLRRNEWPTPLGAIWSARDRVLDRPVFIQVLGAPIADDPKVRRAFQKAAARVAQVTHPGVLQVYDIGDDPSFAVLEHCDGGRMSEKIAAGPMRATDVARAALGLARGLEAMHERGATHGALSPSSILFDGEGRAKILANGAAETARATDLFDATSDQPSGYRPPEHEAMPQDRDRYALAAAAFQMLTGRPPEPGASARALRRSVPAEIDALLRRALSSTPAERPTLDEFVGALAPFARVMPKDARARRFRAGELRWLVPVVLIVGLAAGAATFGVEFVRDLARKETSQPTPSKTPVHIPLAVTDSIDFDPEGSNGENHKLVPNASDGDPLTSWRTVNYRRANLGGKSGVGVLFNLGGARTVNSVRIQTGLPGWTAEIRASDTPGTRASDFAVVATFTAKTDQEITLPATRARYFLVWITQLVDDGGGSDKPFRAEIGEVSFIT